MRLTLLFIALCPVVAFASDPDDAPRAANVSASPAASAVPSTAAAAATDATSPSAGTQVPTQQEDADEKRLRAAGYRPEMHNSTKIWCRRETALGSRLTAQKICGTAKELSLSIQETQDRFIATQNKQWSPTSP
jgi:hypothetical protein